MDIAIGKPKQVLLIRFENHLLVELMRIWFNCHVKRKEAGKEEASFQMSELGEAPYQGFGKHRYSIHSVETPTLRFVMK